MKFLAPYAFWFAATIPVVVIFYLLKRKRVVKLVSSTLLWQKFLAETQANAPFQKLRHNWLLLLQILLLLLAVLALSRPYFAGDTKPAVLRVLILDASASMQSTDVAPSRFEIARADALKWVDSLGDNEEMVVIQAAATAEVKQSATTSKAALRKAIQACRSMDSPTRLKEALKLADMLTRVLPSNDPEKSVSQRTDSEIHLFSDGAVGDLSEFANKNLNLIYHRIGEQGNNVGITTLDVRPNPEEPSQRAIYTSIQNFSPSPRDTELELRFNDQLLEVKSLKVQPGETLPQVFVAAQSSDGVFSVHLNIKDDLAVDNQAFISSTLPQPEKVLLVSRGNRFLEKALKSAGNIELSIAQDISDSGENFDMVVLDNVLPTIWPTANVLAIHVANTNWFDGITTVENPAIVDWKNTHALLRYVNFDNVQIAETLGVKTPTWAVSLVDAQQTPLVLAGELGKQKVLWMGFDSLQSTWPLRVSFPIFIANAAEWLNPAAARKNQLMVRAGEPFHFPNSEAVTNAVFTLPDGTRSSLDVEPGAKEVLFTQTLKQGVYKLSLGTNNTSFCVNLLDPAESNIRPITELQVGKYVQIGESAVKRANMELWRWIATAALVVLLFEWWYYHRRTA